MYDAKGDVKLEMETSKSAAATERETTIESLNERVQEKRGKQVAGREIEGRKCNVAEFVAEERKGKVKKARRLGDAVVCRSLTISPASEEHYLF